MDRLGRLEAARRIDWRFLLPTPGLGRVALVDGDDLEAAAIAESADELGVGAAVDLASRGPWDVVVVDGSVAGDPPAVERAYHLLKPGGWLLFHGRGRARSGGLGALTAGLDRAGAETMRRHWYLPDRRAALRIVPLEDRDAMHVALTRHGGRSSRRAAAAAARSLVRAGVPAALLGGETGILARRPGGEPVSGWPSLEPMSATLAGDLGLERPSWIMLTPRFPASAHVVLLLLAGREVRYVVKIARLADDDGPRHEARLLDALADAGMPRGAAPRSVASANLDGHDALVEDALRGRPLDRRLMRADPVRWIETATTWLGSLPAGTSGAPANLDALVREPLRRLRASRADDAGFGALVARTVDALAPLERRSIPTVFEHGDLSHPNLLIGDDGVLGVIDWELARPDGLPLNDLVFFLGYVALATERGGTDSFDDFARVLAHPAWGAADAVRAEAARWGLDAADAAALVITCWVRAFSGLVERTSLDAPVHLAGDESASRYHRLWEGAVERRAQLEAMLA